MSKNYSYSPSVNSFYDNSLYGVYVNSGTWPDDAFGVEDVVFEEFSAGAVPDGKIRGSGQDGLPLWIDAPERSPGELIAIATDKKYAYMQMATTAIAPFQDAVDLNEASETETELLRKWKKYRVELNRIELQVGYPTAIVWPVDPV